MAPPTVIVVTPRPGRCCFLTPLFQTLAIVGLSGSADVDGVASAGSATDIGLRRWRADA